MLFQLPTLLVAFRILVALVFEIAVIYAGWKIMWVLFLHRINFFRQLVGVPKIQKPKKYKVLQEERKWEKARMLAAREAAKHKSQRKNSPYFNVSRPI